jgi:hypothetical protein
VLTLLTTLETSTSTLRASLKSLQTSPPTHPPSDNSTANGSPTTPNPQKSLADAVNVLEAQYTKLTLVLTNPPLSHGGINEVITDLTTRVFPALYYASAHLVSRKDVWGTLYTASVANKIDAVFTTVETFDTAMRKVVIRSETTTNSKAIASKVQESEKEELYILAGKVFDVCKTTAKFTRDGVAKCLLDRTKEAIDLLHDALEEVRDWSEDVDEESLSGGEDDDDDDDADSEAGDINTRVAGLTIDHDIEDVKRLPIHRSDLRDLLSETNRRVDLITKLYLAASKRRIKKFPDPKLSITPASGAADELHVRNMKRLDEIVTGVEDTSEEMDELAHAFYQLDEIEVKDRLLQMTKTASSVAGKVKTDWEGSEDEFTVWVGKWQGLIERKQSVSSVASASAV